MTSAFFKEFVKCAAKRFVDTSAPVEYPLVKSAVMRKFPKLASYANALELAGLGTLAAPAVSNMAGHPMSEKNKDRAEVVGLGTLAAPYAHRAISGMHPGYAASRVGQGLTRFFGHA